MTGIAWLDVFLGWLDAWGYLIVGAITIFENIFVFGAFTPGETVVAAGAFVASRGHLNVFGVWLSAVFGGVVGSNISYFLGRVGGRDALIRYGDRFRISRRRIEASEEYFLVYGSKTVFLGRFAVGVRSFVPMIAGVAKMGLFWFELHTILGTAVYAAIVCGIGWYAGENMDRALTWVSRVGTTGLVVIIVFLTAVLLGGRRVRKVRARRKEHREEDAVLVEATAGGIIDEPPVDGMNDYEP